MSARVHPFALVLALVIPIYVAFAATSPVGTPVQGDGYYTYLWARTIVFDGDLDFHRDYRVCGDPWNLAHAPVADDVNYWNMGPAIFWIPPLLIERAVLAISGHGSQTSEAEGCSGAIADRAVHGSLVAGLLTIWLAFIGARRVSGVWPAALGSIAAGLLTSLPYYATLMLSYGHAASSFGCGLFFVTWESSRRNANSPRAWLNMGLALGLAMLMRSQNAILVLLPLSTWCQHVFVQLRGPTPRQSALRMTLFGVLFVLSALLIFSPQIAYLHHATGQFFDVSQGEHYMRWRSPRIVQALFATGAGLFTWTPVMYLAFGGWILLARRTTTRAVGFGLLAVFLLDSYVVGSAYDWWGSVGFPGWRFDMLPVPIGYGVAALAARLQRTMMQRPEASATASIAMVLIGLGVWNIGVTAATSRAVRLDLARPAMTHWDEVFAQLSHSTWYAVGNPWAWPASIPFALRHGVHPRAWDVVGSQEFFYHNHQTLDRHVDTSRIDFTAPWTSGYLSGSFEQEPARARGRTVRIARRGRALMMLPLHWPALGALTFEASTATEGPPAQIRLMLNGHDCGVAVVHSERGSIRFAVPSGAARHGINELVLELDRDVALGTLELLDPEPPPTLEQHRRNRELLERRRRATGRSSALQ